jgi:hypothetical protein
VRSRGGVPESGPKGQNEVAGSKNTAGGHSLIGVVKETTERGRGHIVGPVGDVVSGLDINLEEGEVLIEELTTNNWTAVSEEEGIAKQ